MNKLEKAAHIGAIGIIWMLMLLGVLVALAVPLVATEFVNEYSEYANDFWVIAGLLIIPILLAESLLAIILVLLRRIRVDQIFSPIAHKWVRALSYNAAALSASFVVILIWLNIKNTLPPNHWARAADWGFCATGSCAGDWHFVGALEACDERE